MGIIIWLIVGAIAGWVAGKLVPGDEGYGVIGTIIVGIVGALVGGFIFGLVTGEDWVTGFVISSAIHFWTWTCTGCWTSRSSRCTPTSR